MLIVYDRATREVVGHCGKVYDQGAWREATVEELYPDRDRARLEALYVNEVTEAKLFRYGADSFRLVFEESGEATAVELIPALKLRCDAGDADGDGIPDLPADGTSETTITASTTDRAPGVEITFRTTGGALSSRTTVTDAQGEARMNLRASTDTVLATVTASAEGYRPGHLRVEVIPPD